jgi:Mg-chelatase subunit ChlD
MLARSAGTQTTSQMQTLADGYFKAQFNRKEANSPQITVAYSQSNATVGVSGSASVNTSFMGIFGFKTLDVKAASTALWGAKSSLRVALVLDNTGSMASAGKMTALQTATKNLLAKLQSASQTNGDVLVSIVPFAKDVNLGAGNYNQSWLQWDDGTDNSWDGAKGTCSQSGLSPRSQCESNGSCSMSGNSTKASCTAAGTCSISGYSSQSSCTAASICSVSGWSDPTSCNSHGGSWNAGQWTTGVWTGATWTPTSHTTWNGCVIDRGDTAAPSSGNYDTNVVAPSTATPATLYVPESYSSCPQAAMALNYNWSVMTSLVSNLSPAGNTNQGLGLQLGWLSLTQNPVLNAPSKNSGITYADHIILLTDGLNTENRWYTDQASIDAREAMLCQNVKNAGVTLWTIQVNTDGDPTSTLLQKCATDSSKFFLLTSADQIISTFDNISFKITQLHLSK